MHRPDEEVYLHQSALPPPRTGSFTGSGTCCFLARVPGYEALQNSPLSAYHLALQLHRLVCKIISLCINSTERLSPTPKRKKEKEFKKFKIQSHHFSPFLPLILPKLSNSLKECFYIYLCVMCAGVHMHNTCVEITG